MDRDSLLSKMEGKILKQAGRLYGVEQGAFKLIPGYEGCANLVYEYTCDHQPRILRITFSTDRSAELIQAELNFIEYLAQNGVRASRPISQDGNLLETMSADNKPLHLVSFVRGRGMRVPDNGYRYRDDAPIEEYFQNWGQMLGRMHALTKAYQPPSREIRRPDWFDLHQVRLDVDGVIPARLTLVGQRIEELLAELRALPRDRDVYGLVHGDFNDGNFTVDYSNGDMTVFDFDDCCYFWFAYELASAWEGGIGRTMFRPLAERQAFMDHYMAQVMEGYQRENTLPEAWLSRIPLFTRLIHVEEILHFVRYIDTDDPDMQAENNYRIRCIEEEIPYLGFFDSIYSHEKPFSL